jgi:hypothetical protein
MNIEVHLYNSLVKYGPGNRRMELEVPDGVGPADVARMLSIPPAEIYAAWHNGRNIMTAFGGTLETSIALHAGDRLAFSGPVPFSRGYGAPVC